MACAKRKRKYNNDLTNMRLILFKVFHLYFREKRNIQIVLVCTYFTKSLLNLEI